MFFIVTGKEELRKQIIEVAILRFEEEAECQMIAKNQRTQYLNDQLHLVKADISLMNLDQLHDYLRYQKRKLDKLLMKEPHKYEYEMVNEINTIENEETTICCCNLM